MIISILTLTKFVGVYSYMIGLAANYLITGTLNLILLKKVCGGLKYIKYTVHALIVTVSACAFGILLDGIISSYVHIAWQIVICSLACILFSTAFLYCLEMFTFRPLKKLISKS